MKPTAEQIAEEILRLYHETNTKEQTISKGVKMITEFAEEKVKCDEVNENGWQDCKLENLKTGDLVRHKSGGTPYVVISHYGSRVTAVATRDITNEIEWNHLLK